MEPARAVPLPRQARGRARFEALLRAAAELIAEEGVDGVAFSRIARRAGAAQGSLYQYFPSKEALVLTLHERLLAALVEAVRACAEAFAARSGPRTVEALAAELVPALADFYAEHPAYREIRHALPREPAVEAAEARADAEVAMLLGPLVAGCGLRIPEDRAPLVAGALIEAGDALLPWAGRDAARKGEVERLVVAYLRAAGEG
jgi:AcrR family transcriptional regulator